MKLNRGYSETKASYNDQRLSKLCRYGKFCQYILPQTSKTFEPIYDLTRKGRQFLWEKEQQQAFDEIKHRLQRPPVLHLPNRHG